MPLIGRRLLLASPLLAQWLSSANCVASSDKIQLETQRIGWSLIFMRVLWIVFQSLRSEISLTHEISLVAGFFVIAALYFIPSVIYFTSHRYVRPAVFLLFSIAFSDHEDDLLHYRISLLYMLSCLFRWSPSFYESVEMITVALEYSKWIIYSFSSKKFRACFKSTVFGV